MTRHVLLQYQHPGRDALQSFHTYVTGESEEEIRARAEKEVKKYIPGATEVRVVQISQNSLGEVTYA